MHITKNDQKIEDQKSFTTLDTLEQVSSDAGYSEVPGSMSKTMILKVHINGIIDLQTNRTTWKKIRKLLLVFYVTHLMVISLLLNSRLHHILSWSDRFLSVGDLRH